MAPSIGSDMTPARGLEQAFSLPPLILHPFADAAGPERLVESSRASLVLQGLLPGGAHTPEDLERKLIDGRYCEIRMLFYVGRDVMRWVGQCMDFATRNRLILPAGIEKQSFIDLLIESAPSSVEDKLRKWGVADYKAIFSRAIGLNSMFAEVPPRNCLSDEFMRNYFRYADQLFAFSQGQAQYTRINSGRFDFELYYSGEYARMLEREWEA
jgi:hypothetical protein